MELSKKLALSQMNTTKRVLEQSVKDLEREIKQEGSESIIQMIRKKINDEESELESFTLEHSIYESFYRKFIIQKEFCQKMETIHLERVD